MCAFGMVQGDELGEGLITKPIACMGNCETSMEMVAKKFTNGHRLILVDGEKQYKGQNSIETSYGKK